MARTRPCVVQFRRTWLVGSASMQKALWSPWRPWRWTSSRAATKVQESLVAVHQDNHKRRSCHDHAGGAANGILTETAEVKARARAKALAKGKAKVSNRNSGRDNSHNRGGNLRRSDHSGSNQVRSRAWHHQSSQANATGVVLGDTRRKHVVQSWRCSLVDRKISTTQRWRH